MSMRLISKEQEELILKNRKLVYYLVNKLKINNSDYEDIVSIGTIGLIKAATTFDKSKNIKFATYATRCINNEIFMHFRKEKSHINDISLDDSIGNDGEGNELTLRDKIPNSDKDFTEVIEENEIFIKFISIILNLLESRERLIMLYKIAGIKQSFVAEIFNISQSYISRLEKKLNKKVKSYFSTKKNFEEVFSMAIVGDFYQISFSSENIKNFNKIFATLLKNITSTEDLPDFKVSCNKERIIVQVLAHPESFSFIAQIIQEIDNYSMRFVSNKNMSSNEDNSLNMKTDDANNYMMKENRNSTIEEKNRTTEKLNIKDSKVKQVRDYMLSMDYFTIKELKQHFPNLTSGTISNAIHLAKAKGLITSTIKGEYKVIKN